MSDDTPTLITPRQLPAAATDPRPSLPSLPGSSGALWGSPSTILKKDTAFVEAHTAYLQARNSQTAAMRELVNTRHALAIAISKLAALPEIAQHEYEKGRRDRAHDMEMQQLMHQTAEANARINLVRTQQHLVSVSPHLKPGPEAGGLSPTDVEKVAQAIPELTPDTIQTLVLALGGLLAEKNK